MKSNKKVFPLACALTFLLSGLGASIVNAQTSDSAARSPILDEVMVYGTKRSSAEQAQDTASQVAAFGSSQLEARHVLNVEDLSFATPNVQLDSVGTQASYASFSIRGLGIDNSTPSIDANVGVFTDGVYNGTGFGIVTDTFDLESIEVYKGPQSLLFGRNVTGGAVLLRSKRPNVGSGFDFNAKVAAETDQQIVAAAAEGDLVDNRLAGRLAVQYSADDGWFDNDQVGQTGAQDTELVRGTLVYTPSDVTMVTFIAENGRLYGDATPVQDLNTVLHSPVDPDSNQYTSRFPVRPDNDEFNVNHNFVGEGDVDWSQYTLETSWLLGGATITNILGYREVEAFASADIDGTPAEALSSLYVVDQNQLSNEIRLNVDLTEHWITTVGVAYFEQEYDYVTGLTIGTPDTAPGGNDRLGGGVQEHQSISFYWDNEYKITDTFSLIGGANYVKEDKDVLLVAREQASIADGTCDVTTNTCDFSRGYPGSDSWSNVSPKLGFQWWALDEAQVYGHWTVAYRSGFYNLRPCCDALVTNPTPTDVEKHTAFEVGLKSDLLDRRLRLNTAFFVQNIDDLARSAGYVLPDGAPAQDLVNIGDARIMGLEVDLLAQLTDRLVITAAAGLLDGDILDAKTDINADGVIGDHADESMALTRLSPKSMNLGFIYDMPLGNGILSLSSNYNYRDEAAARDDNGAFFPAATIINAGIDYVPNEGPWSFHLYGKNLRDEVVYSTLFTLSNARVYAPIKEGRRYGVEVRYDF
ncbi:MAG: TonB-dependent receptor [Cellvibrionaceae bacterium]